MTKPFPAELNRVARGWPLRSLCRQKLQVVHSKLLLVLAALHEAPTIENMAWVNAIWAHAWRTLETCGEYKPGPSGTPAAEKKQKVA